jgi:hypothetical protein
LDLFVLSTALGVITMCLWALDWRNRMLVDADEALGDRREGDWKQDRVTAFNIIEATDSKPKAIRYSKILGVMFTVFLLLSILGIVFFSGLLTSVDVESVLSNS